jgi:aromatic-amino-acid transaminase
MFETLSPQPNDPLLALIGLFKADPRADKVDLGVGVYRDETGATPILRAVKEAERRILAEQVSKSYVAPEGDLEFVRLLWEVVAGGGSKVHASGVQTPGGSGALRLASELIGRSGTGRIWLGLPSWPNHAGIFSAAGLQIETYPYFDVPSQTILFDRMIDALGRAERGDAVLLHASCHNPTGAVLTLAQWREIADVLVERGLVPLIDSAYQGFGAGVEEDVAGLRTVIETVPEALVAVSSSKCFGLYRERTGAVFAVASDARTAEIAQSNLTIAARTSYSMPPDHGAAIVRTILSDATLKADWIDELNTMRGRLIALRQGLSRSLGNRFPNAAAISEQEGMFSLLPLAEAQVMTLRKDHGIYMPASGRINIAGLKSADIERVATAFASL